MAISAEQWKEIKQELDGLIGKVEFRYKEHQLTVQVEKVKRSLELCVYVDGKIKREWIDETHELRPFLEEVWYRKEKYLFSAKLRKEYKGFLSKKELNKKNVVFYQYFLLRLR
ncbi:hypothetical protein F543_6060 [Bibersteinia trehalosi USDA-ARS-USMARC-189]|uniref:Uncharacterized protein n=1 Tax=Bibersteinia trehalosi USDA-ARS-USMARC-189 TaxID=1263831 RepID=A0ABN4C489_BIBTR|nr:hypothetical protein [Bibersteinia trehalosi]AHG83470.1 hypothetical protein F543_6060 [Bibersteinia trehalosi USDA-ARS-USMARC-189]